jgi:hypothetical protein
VDATGDDLSHPPSSSQTRLSPRRRARDTTTHLAGRLDRDLSRFIASINAQTTAIAAARTAATLSRLRTGQCVRLDQCVKPNYLRGETATFHERDGYVVVVFLDRVVGRFSSRHVRCALHVLELLD